MIRQLTTADKHIVDSMKKTPLAMRIASMCEGYGFERSFIQFFADECGDIVIAQKNGKAFLYLNDKEKLDEAVSFIRLITSCVITDTEIACLNGTGVVEHGIAYSKSDFEQVKLSGVTNEIQPAYYLLERVFPESVNSTTYPVWYTDMSHMVRHGITKVYTINGICTVTMTGNMNGTVLISHLATLSIHRKQGYAMEILAHLMQDQRADLMVLLSQDKASDRFYEKNGFEKTGEWYFYDWKHI